jgi:dihydroxy-acid dehydratase
MTVFMALGGSTNAVVHLIAMAGRAGIKLTLDDIDAVSARHPSSATCARRGSI